MILIGCVLSILMGLVLGNIGAGGSILILPILVYFIGLTPTLATSYSLIIVGLTALVGSIRYIQKRHVNIWVSLIFGIPSLLAVYCTRRYFMPIFPDSMQLGSVTFTKDFIIMILFSFLMFLAAYLMIFSKETKLYNNNQYIKYLLIVVQGSIVGFFTGIIGAGGGFLIIPALVVFSGLNMKTAIGSSLLIIFIKSFFGFIGDIQSDINIDYSILSIISMCTIFGILIGSSLSEYINSNNLKKYFGYFIAILSFVIIISESINN